MSTTASPVMELANELADLCREGKNLEAIEKFYSPDIVSIEVCDMPEMPATMQGIEAIKAKNKWWIDNHEVHGLSIEGPFPHGDRFILTETFEVTPKFGPMEGQRVTMQEAGLYTVADGKIVKEEFFYDMKG